MTIGIKGFQKGHETSIETRKKIGDANRNAVYFDCNYCNKKSITSPAIFNKKNRHFCSMKCYSNFRKEFLPLEEQHAYRGIRKNGESRQVYHRRYVATHKINISHLKARRYAREKGAVGSHTLQEWNSLKELHNQQCAKCGKKKTLTKDHIIPLSKGGTDFIENIQPLCKNCNSKKWCKIENIELLK